MTTRGVCGTVFGVMMTSALAVDVMSKWMNVVVKVVVKVVGIAAINCLVFSNVSNKLGEK